MKLRLETEATTFRLAQPFVIARGTREAIDLVSVTVHAEGAHAGLTGRGEGAPSARYGEDAARVLAQLEAVRPRIEAGIDRGGLREVLPPGSARNALDAALWDLEAKVTGHSVFARTGTRPSELVTAVTVGIDTPRAMAQRARQIVRAHGPCDVPALLKIKLDAHDIAARVRAVREAAPEATLIADANESWSLGGLEAALPALHEVGIELLEQPLPAGADAELAGLGSPVPLSADESAHVAVDVPFLAARYDYVTIKLDKSGGLTEALALAEAARAAGMGVMTGCMLCSSLSVAAAWPLAVRSRFVDLDGPLWLAQDRPGGSVVRCGKLQAPMGLSWGEPG